ncbi:acyl-coenzyme A thioesterase 9, mitochondrial-like [Periplaneta americana]|uniref:acyl-coenzyme A thioesterase 9, mitochondrial-like n=1 Tax=Periplaneta americana TaxID=6978 RepID=UPI0037E761D9
MLWRNTSKMKMYQFALRTCSSNIITTNSSTAADTTGKENSYNYNSQFLSANDITISEMKKYASAYMGLDRGYKPLKEPRTHLLKLLPESQDELPVRKMCDSFSTAVIPLKDDKELQEKYVTVNGNVRLGRLMEDMDVFAVWVTYKHILNPRQKPEDYSPYVIVTLLIDRMSFTSFQPKSDANIHLSGHVSWVGKSSIEVMVWAEQYVHGTWEKITRALFLTAARNSNNDGPAVVNRLMPVSESEKKIFNGGENRRKNRILRQQASLLKVVPNSEEQQVIHDLFLKTVDKRDPTIHRRTLPPDSEWMDDHVYNSIVYGHPEERNMHDKIFGGFLMRNALELAWMSAGMYSKYRPELLHISDIHFQKPVNVGSVINMHAHVVYTERNYVQMAVFADVLDPVTSHNITTNSFQYTFENPVEVYRILPRSYSDAMLYIDGRRHFQKVMRLLPKSNL